MILGFKTHIEGKPTHFPEKILANVDPRLREIYTPKLTTIREGFRWEKGMRIHMATGVRTKNYHQFNKGIPGLQYCTGVQDIYILHPHVLIWKKLPERRNSYESHELDTLDIQALALNDGFNSSEEFWDFFDYEHVGQIIFFTDQFTSYDP